MDQGGEAAMQARIEFFLTYKALSNFETGPPLMKVAGHYWPTFMAGYWPKIYHFPVRDDDVVLTGFPVSGTPWLKYVLEQLFKATRPNFKDSQIAAGVLENVLSWNGGADGIEVLDKFGAEPSPRIIWTHLNVSLLPYNIFDSKAKVIYIRREPKDAAAGLYSHYMDAVAKMTGFDDTFEQYVDRFLRGEIIGGPYPEHVNAFLKLQREDPEKVLIVDCKDLEQNRKEMIKAIAKFLGLELDESTADRLANETSLAYLRGKDAAEMAKKSMTGEWKVKDESFWQSDMSCVGASKKYFKDSESLIRRFEAGINAKLDG